LRASTAEALVVVFARAPVPGRAKTRLVPRLGAWGAARLQARLTLRTLGMARAFEVELHGTSRHAFFRSTGVPFVLQRGRDLGERMHHAIENALRRHRAVIIVGTDCPVLGARDLRRAARLLRSSDAVLAPAEDGGYALIGMRRSCRAAFEGIDWGTASVFAQTSSRLARTGLRWKTLRTVWDLDRPADLERLRSLRFSAGSRRAARR
jgi:uncharacterized protein